MVNGKYAVALIGYGGMGHWHAELLKGFDRIFLHGIFDIDPAKMKEAGENGYEAYDSFDAVLADDKIDVLVLAVPNDWHKPYAVQALRAGKNVISEKPVTLSPAPHPSYNRDADKVLTNGIHGTNDYKIQWLGWDVPRFEAVLDLGSEQQIGKVTATYLQTLTDWIFFPKQVTFYVSSDGQNYTQVGMEAQPEVNQSVSVGVRDYSSAVNRKGRYVKVVTDGVGTCPPWHLGAGGKAFAFMDEIIVE